MLTILSCSDPNSCQPGNWGPALGPEYMALESSPCIFCFICWYSRYGGCVRASPYSGEYGMPHLKPPLHRNAVCRRRFYRSDTRLSVGRREEYVCSPQHYGKGGINTS